MVKLRSARNVTIIHECLAAAIERIVSRIESERREEVYVKVGRTHDKQGSEYQVVPNWRYEPRPEYS